MESALAILPRTRPATTITSTPFYEFLVDLHANEPTPIAVLQDGSIWSGPDLLSIIFDGLWVVMSAVAQKHNLRMETEQEVWETVAPIVNRLVNVGLVLTGTKVAANQFQQEVLKPVLQKLNARRGQTIENPSTLWTQEALAFFAKLYKLGREKIEALNKLARIVANNNTVHKNGRSTHLVSNIGATSNIDLDSMDGNLAVYGKRIVNHLLIQFDPEEQRHWSKEEPSYEKLLPQENTLKHARALQKAVQDLPDRMIPPLAKGESATTWEVPNLDEQAIKTQVLLALAQKPLTTTRVESEERTSLANSIKTYRVEECEAMFWHRMKQLGYQNTPPAILLAHVRDMIEEIKRIQAEETCIGLNIFLQASIEQVGMINNIDDAEKACQAHLREKDQEEDKEDEKVYLPRDAFKQDILPRINEKTLNAEVLKYILKHISNDRESIILLLRKANAELRDPYLEAMAHSDPSLMRRFVEEGWLKPDKKTEEQIFKEHNQTRLQRLLTKLEELNEKGITPEKSDIADLLRYMSYDKVEGRNIISDPKRRELFRSTLDVVERENMHLKIHNESIDDFFAGEELLRLLLADEVAYRESVYGDPPDAVPEDEELCLPEWKTLGDSSTIDHPLRKSRFTHLEIRETQIKTLLKGTSEDKIFLWLHEANPDRDQRYQAFVANRKAYYERKLTQGFKVPPEFKPAAPSPPKRKPAKRR